MCWDLRVLRVYKELGTVRSTYTDDPTALTLVLLLVIPFCPILWVKMQGVPRGHTERNRQS